LRNVLDPTSIVGTDETIDWENFSGLQPGKVHMLGSWQVPLVRRGPSPDIFWNAASFGEMEPDVVENYLSYFRGSANWIYLLQARQGKETSGQSTRVGKPTTFDDYCRMLPGYELAEEHDAAGALKRMSASGGYFEAVWRRSNPSVD
jgi:hypothetical protein